MGAGAGAETNKTREDKTESSSGWICCEGCSYENGSVNNKACAMCGGQYIHAAQTMMPIVEGGEEDGFTGNNDRRKSAPSAAPFSK